MPRQRRINTSMDPGPCTRTRGAQSRVQQSKRLKLDEELDKLKFIFATRKVLKQNGFPAVKRFLSRQLQGRVKGFMTLVEEEPQLYGIVGSIKWKQGLLSYLNEPTTLTWDDVDDWLNNPVHDLFFGGTVSTPSRNTKLVPVKRASTSEDFTLHRDKKPRLKLGIVKLTKCDARLSQQPTVNNSVNVDENEDVGQFFSGTSDFGEQIAAFLDFLDKDGCDIPTESMESESVQPVVKNTKNEEVPTHDEASPFVVQAPDVQETQLQAIEEVAEVNLKSDIWLSNLEHYQMFGEMEMSGIGEDLGEEIQLFEGNATSNNGVCVVDDLNTPVPSPLEQLPAEATETTAQNSETDALEVIEYRAPTQNVEGVDPLSTNGELQIPANIPWYNQSTSSARDPEVSYQNLITEALEWLNNKCYQYPNSLVEPVPILCPICKSRRLKIAIIQNIDHQLVDRTLMLHVSERQLDLGKLSREHLQLSYDLDNLGQKFLHENSACPCRGNNNNVQ